MKTRVKRFLEVLKSKKAVALMTCTAVITSSMTAMFAEDVPVATQVTTALATTKSDILGVVAVAAVAAIPIFGAILGWKYGKKIFSQLAK
jgi:hypothetical protein